MEVLTPSLPQRNGSKPPKNPAEWTIDPPAAPARQTIHGAGSSPVDPLEERVSKALGERLEPIELPESFLAASGLEETPQQLAELDVAVGALCRQEPQRARAAADAEALAHRANGRIAVMGEQRREAREALGKCPRRVRRTQTKTPSLTGGDAYRPMVVTAGVLGLLLVLLFGIEQANATLLATTASWPFTETIGTAFLFTVGFVVGPFGLLWWAEASAAPRLKKRLIAARRWVSLGVAAASLIAFGLAVGLEHGEVTPMFDEPEPWGVPVPLLTALSVSMLALTMLAGKSGLAACWNSLCGVELVANPQLEELRKAISGLDEAIAAPTTQLVLAKKLLSRLEADIQTHQTDARQRLRMAIEQAAKESRRRDIERRLRLARAEQGADAA